MEHHNSTCRRISGGEWQYHPDPLFADQLWSWRSSNVVDLDGDGNMEILTNTIQSSSNGEVFLLVPDADGNLTPHVLFNMADFGATRLAGGAVGDIDQDGNLDYVFGARSGKLQMLLSSVLNIKEEILQILQAILFQELIN